MEFPQLFDITVKPQKLQFTWAVHVGQATLSDLKDAIQEKCPAIEITDETTITYTATSGAMRFITDNSNLQDLLITQVVRQLPQPRQYRTVTVNLETRT